MNNDVDSQDIVLLSSRRGFAFAIAAEIVLRGPLTEEMHRVTYSFFATGLLSPATMGAGILDSLRERTPSRAERLPQPSKAFSQPQCAVRHRAHAPGRPPLYGRGPAQDVCGVGVPHVIAASNGRDSWDLYVNVHTGWRL